MKYLNALNKIDGVGRKKLKLLVQSFNSGKDIWQADFDKLRASGIEETLASKIIKERAKIDPDQEWKKLEAEQIIVVSINDALYPSLLKEIPDCPNIIYMKGDITCLKLPPIAIVGSRKRTSYGSQAARIFARDLASNGICVVSGLAFGIDACSHLGALEAKGKTIAVLGNGLDEKSIAPRTNLRLAQNILKEGGLLISEFPVGMEAQVWTFPARNRIMAGMSLGTLVIEAAEKSGSLITANLALDYNREVFAVPGSIFSPQSTGTNLLIKRGAKITRCVQDVLEELKLNIVSKQEIKNKISLNKTEEKIVNVLSHESLYIDIISKLTKLETSTISSTLAILEIKGVVKNVGGQNYIRL